jgi:hypothetical protein
MLIIHPSKATETEKACVFATVGNVHFRKMDRIHTPSHLSHYWTQRKSQSTAVRYRHTIAGEHAGMCLE